MLDYTLFGESHGPVVGVLLRHVPAGVPIDELQMERDLLRRRPSGALATARQEPDEVQFLSGVFQGRTTGMPLVMALPNRDARPQDYEALRSVAGPATRTTPPGSRPRAFRTTGAAGTSPDGSPRRWWRQAASPKRCWPVRASP